MSTSEKASELNEQPASFVWRRALIGLVVLIVGLVTVGFLWQKRDVPSTESLHTTVAALDFSDPNWRLEGFETARAGVPEPVNSARVVIRAARLLPRAWPPIPLDDRVRDLDHVPNVRPDAETMAVLRGELTVRAAALAEARKLVAMPRGRHHLAYAVNPHSTLLLDQHETRKVVTLLRYDALERAQKADLRAALESCRAALNAARALGDEPFVISQLIRTDCIAVAAGMVERVLALGEATDRDLAALQLLLSAEEKHPTLLVCLRGERALLDDLYTKLETGKLDADPVVRQLASDFGARLDWKTQRWGVSRALLRREHARSLELMTSMIEIAGLPEHEQKSELDKLGARIDALPDDALLTRMLVSKVLEAGEPCRRKTARVRSLITLLAVERYRLKHDKWPDGLDDLKADFLVAVPLDPYDGKPLRYIKRPDGVTVYSIGADGTDDGGRIDRSKPRGPGVDEGYRLWDIKARRLAPAGRK
jgi:hypothetical protein